jgi:hypothetical protein
MKSKEPGRYRVGSLQHQKGSHTLFPDDVEELHILVSLWTKREGISAQQEEYFITSQGHSTCKYNQ